MPLDLSWAVLPIFRGPLKGARWMLATRSNFFLGTYEPEQTALFAEVVKPGAVVYDVGAHFGYYTVLGSRLAGPKGQVIAFEPSPANLLKLRKHIAINDCSNVRLLELAVSDHLGTARFETRTGSGVGHLASDGPLEVQLTTVDTIAQQHPLPTVMKIDVEGAEVGVLEGARQTLERAHPTIFLSLHGEDLKTRCMAFLRNLGYEFQEILPMEMIAHVK